MAKDIRLQGQQLIGTSCDDKKEVVHPETCLDAILLSHEASTTLKKWLSTPPNNSQTRSLPLESSLYQWLVQNYNINSHVDLSNYYNKQYIDTLATQLSALADANNNGYMTKEHWSKLNGIEAGAKANVQADLTETDSQSDAFVRGKDEFAASIISSIGIGLNIEVVDTLPTTDISYATIYLVPHTLSETSNVYDEYIRLQAATQSETDRWELIGTTSIDFATLTGQGLVYDSTANQIKTNGNVIPVEAHTTETADDTAFAVMGVTIGSLTNGSVIKKSETLESVIKKILIKVIDVVIGGYPSATITNSGTTPGTYEVGATVLPKLGINSQDGQFVSSDPDNWSSTQNAGCTVTVDKYYRGVSTEISGGEESYQLPEGATEYKATYNYSDNANTPVKNNGDASEAHIDATTSPLTTSNRITYNGRFKYCLKQVAFRTHTAGDYSDYFGDLTDTDITNATTLLGNVKTSTSTVVNSTGITSAAATPCFLLALPSDMAITGSLNSLGQSNLDVWKLAGTGITHAINNETYKVYVFESSQPILIKSVTVKK